MITKPFQSAIRLLVAAGALGTTAVGVATALPVDAAGLRNCVDVPASKAGRAAATSWSGPTASSTG